MSYCIHNLLINAPFTLRRMNLEPLLELLSKYTKNEIFQKTFLKMDKFFWNAVQGSK